MTGIIVALERTTMVSVRAPFATGASLVVKMRHQHAAGCWLKYHGPLAPPVQHGLDLAASLDLFVTGSSDYHGDGKPNLLGENTTDPVVLQQIEALASGVEVLRP